MSSNDPQLSAERVKQTAAIAVAKGQSFLDKGKETISGLEADIQALRQTIAAAHRRGQALVNHGREQAQKLPGHFEPILTQSNQRVQDLVAELPLAATAEWSTVAWQKWEAQPISRLDLIRYGTMTESRDGGRLSLPAFAPFVGKGQCVIIRSSGGSVDTGRHILQSLLTRAALMLPHQASFLLLDPAGNGMAFPMRRFIPQVRPNTDDVRRDLDQVTQEIRRINETFLDASVPSFELIPEDMRLNERYLLIFAADFPNRYDRRAQEALHSIAATGPRAGVYLFLHWNSDIELPRDLPITEFKNSFNLDASPATVTIANGITFSVTPDTAPPADLQETLFARLRAATPTERRIEWDEVIGLSEDQWWTTDSSTRIETPIGKKGRGDSLALWFGEKDNRPCVHGILGAMPGAGKSSLYHALIAGLTTRYSPEELRLYLIDGKFGVEFQPYKRLPHAEVVSLRTLSELARSVLRELVQEMRRRNDIFSRHGVASLMAYRAIEQPSGKMPRILLIVDEYQVLFEEDQNGEASLLLKQLSELGRSAGIHMLLASQRFGATGMLNQQAVFGNIHLRIAMMMAETTVRSLTEFGPRGRSLIVSTCNLPGKLVVNDMAGDDNANVSGKAAFLNQKRRDEVLQALQLRAATLKEEQLPRRVVFNGEEQPELLENPQLYNLLQDDKWLNDQELERFARQPLSEGGLFMADWFAVQRPRVVWLGQEFNVRGQASVVMRRRSGEHLLVIGASNEPVRYGMLGAVLASLSVSSSPRDSKFFIVDRSTVGAQWSSVLQTACDDLLRPAGFSVDYTRDGRRIEPILQALTEEIERRRSLDDEERIQEPSIFVVMTDLDTVDAMRRRPGQFGMTESALGEHLRRLYMESAVYGIHFILSLAGLNALSNIIDTRRDLVHFRHRVVLQMSEDESFVLVRSRKAAQLQPEPRPITALYFDMENEQRAARFKPYSTEPGQDATNGPLEQQLREIGTRLSVRNAL
jgi:DNA segregation ATPase FtsK/SpoIIIE, S-DNA-T family